MFNAWKHSSKKYEIFIRNKYKDNIVVTKEIDGPPGI